MIIDVYKLYMGSRVGEGNTYMIGVSKCNILKVFCLYFIQSGRSYKYKIANTVPVTNTRD